MPRGPLVAIVAVIVVGAGCGGGGGSDKSADTTTTSEATTVATYGGVPGAAQRVSCESDVRQLQQLSDFYKASHGQPAPSLQTFVDEGDIDHAPTNDHGYVISYDAATGKVGATGACTVP